MCLPGTGEYSGYNGTDTKSYLQVSIESDCATCVTWITVKTRLLLIGTDDTTMYLAHKDYGPQLDSASIQRYTPFTVCSQALPTALITQITGKLVLHFIYFQDDPGKRCELPV